MRLLISLAAAAALTGPIVAQNTLTTLFAANNGGASEWCQYFDITCQVPVDISQFDINSNTAAGVTGTIDVYVVQNASHVGNELMPTFWPAAPTETSMMVTAAGVDVPSPAVLNAPISLPIGTHAICLHYRTALAPAYTNGTGANQQFSDSNITIDLGTSTSGLFTGNLFDPRVCNTTVYYTVQNTPGLATSAPFGVGCGDEPGPATAYELFPVGGIDLSNTGQTLTLNANGGYDISPTASAIVPPSPTSAIPFLDDEVQNFPLGFTMSTPAGDITDVGIGSNGFITTEPHTIQFHTFSVNELITSVGRWLPLWIDLNPAAGGTIHAEADAVTPGLLHITFDQVVEFGTSNANTFQVSLHQNGTVEFKYGTITGVGAGGAGGSLVGYTIGNGVSDPGSIDWTAASGPLTASERSPVELVAVNRPVLGTSFDLEIQNVPATGGAPTIAGTIVGLPIPGGISLDAIGAVGCFLYVQEIATLVNPPSFGASTIPVSVTIPNNASLSGNVVSLQGVVVNPAYSGLGIAATNGINATLDVN